MISNIQVASAEGLRPRTRWPRTVVYDPNGTPNLVSYGEPSSTCSIDTSVLVFCVESVLSIGQERQRTA